MDSITGVTMFFVILMSTAAVVVLVLLGVLAGRLVSEHRATKVARGAAIPSARSTGVVPVRRLVASGRRTVQRGAHQH